MVKGVIGVVADEENAVKMIFLARSSVESRMEQLFGKYRRLARLVQAEMKIRDQYPGWEYRRVSPLRDDFLKIAGQVYGDAVTPRATAIHAGLECGFILSAASHEIDAISIGPNLKNIHTPEESLELASCERLWNIVRLLLARK
jgi:dipeptidase D